MQPLAKQSTIRILLALGCAAGSTSAWARQDQVSIDLTGVQFRNGVNQARDSSPQHINPGFGYRYHIDGMVKGNSGLLQILFPNPTPLADALETLAPGSSEALDGEGYNPSGTLPLEVLNQTFTGSTVIFGVTINAGATVSGGIRADGVTYFSVTNVVLQPSFIVGSMSFTSGSAVTTRIPAITADMNWDGVVDFFDIDPFILGLNDPAAYILQYGYDPLYPGDVNRDGALDFFDIDPFVALVIG